MKLRGLLVTSLLGLLAIPLIALVLFSSPKELISGIQHQFFLDALYISFVTSISSILIVLIICTPAAWWLTQMKKVRSIASVLIDVPIILPPAVVGVGLVIAFSANGPLGAFGIEIGTTILPVMIAQIIVGAPFYLKASMNAFDQVDNETLLVARSLGASELNCFYQVALPLALPGIMHGMTLSFARIVGEFGATLIFAGNIPGKTQTLPMAIFQIYESNIGIAVEISVVMALGTIVLFAIISFLFQT